ncbi:MAG TPA: Na+/H+ antiporter NhaA [Chitinophagaceae bacterium]|nr:Na+/H+ antiporter NhaA [Chitinophagaceae bacterium]
MPTLSIIKRSLHHISTPIRKFLTDSRSVGIILIVCTIVSLLLSNLSFTQSSYAGFFQRNLNTAIGFLNIPQTPLSWINDVLMTFFFFLVGMEIKRELSIGELASVKKSLLPIVAALGGMICPAVIFTIFNGNTQYHHGWGIPMATDIAFSLGILSLLGKRVPVQLKIFLAALAIIDDLGAVITIAIFYTSKLQLVYLLTASGTVAFVILLNLLKVSKTILYLIPGIILWYSLFNSGVHPTISGVIMAFSMPLFKLEKLERFLYYPVNFFIMPLFALANTAIVLPSHFANIFTSTISLGVMLGLIIGKPVGIFLFSFLASKTGIASLPNNTTFKQLLGIGMLGGIGFTMSIFTATLAYNVEDLQIVSKVCIICASIVSSFIGYTYLKQYKPIIEKKEKHFMPGYKYDAPPLTTISS